MADRARAARSRTYGSLSADSSRVPGTPPVGPIQLGGHRFARGDRVEVGHGPVGGHQAMGVRRAGRGRADRLGEQGADRLAELDDAEPEVLVRGEFRGRDVGGRQIRLLLDPVHRSLNRREVIGDAAVAVVANRARQFQWQPPLHRTSPSVSVPVVGHLITSLHTP